MSWLSSPRNRAFALAAAGSFAAAGIGTYLYAAYVATKKYKLEAVNVITGNTTGTQGVEDPQSRRLKILHISDLHLCYPESHKLEFLRRVSDDDYDLVVLTGDIFEDFSGLRYAGNILARQPRLGAYAVLGNHDYYDYNMIHKTIGRFWRRFKHPNQFRDVEPIVRALEQSGFTVLQNSARTLPEEKLYIIGLDYPGISTQEFQRLSKQAPEDYMVIALQHVPKNLARLPQHGIDLAFAGHTHGGQVRVPGVGALITNCELPRHEAAGLFWRDQTAIHVSRGVGADPRSNFRLFCPPHATILHVRHHFASY